MFVNINGVREKIYETLQLALDEHMDVVILTLPDTLQDPSTTPLLISLNQHQNHSHHNSLLKFAN